MVRVERQSETEVLYHHQMKMLSQAIETLVAQHSEELHYHKNFDFAKRYTIQLDEKTIPDYNAPAYVPVNGKSNIRPLEPGFGFDEFAEIQIRVRRVYIKHSTSNIRIFGVRATITQFGNR